MANVIKVSVIFFRIFSTVYVFTYCNKPLSLQTRQAPLPKPGPPGTAAGTVARSPVRPHEAHVGVAPRLALRRAPSPPLRACHHGTHATCSRGPNTTLIVLIRNYLVALY